MMETDKEFLENIISMLPGHIYWKYKNGVLLGCNDEQAKFIGLKSRFDIVGLTAYDTLPKHEADEVTKNDREAMETGNTIVTEEVVVSPNGKKTIWLSKKVPLKDKEDNVTGILGISIDITAKKELDVASLLGASIAHELRTPLMSIWNCSRLIEYDIEAKNLVLEHVQAIKNEVNKSNQIINIMLANVLKPVLNKLKETSIVHCINEAIERYPYSDPSNKNLFRCNTSVDFTFLGDKTLMIHVLFNLMKNALYFIHKAGKGNIFLSCTQNEKYNILLFKDTGLGIPKDKVNKIFEKYYTTTDVGSGIGLSFCKFSMELLGGTIECNSKLGEYTEFVLYFPKIGKESKNEI